MSFIIKKHNIKQKYDGTERYQFISAEISILYTMNLPPA